MNQFDLDSYLNNRSRVDSKLASIMQASQEKTSNLAELQAADAEWRQQKEAEARANANSWTSRLGMPADSAMGTLINSGASLVSGTSRLLGHLASTPNALDAALLTQGVQDEDVSAFNRLRKGEVTPEDAQRLATPDQSGMRPIDRLHRMERDGDTIGKVNKAMDLSSIVHQGRRNELAKDLKDGFDPAWKKITEGDGWDKATGLVDLLINASGSLLTNPIAVTEYIVENAPQLLVGVAGKLGQGVMLASNLGYAADNFQQGMANYAKKNGGQMPPPEEQRRMAALSLSLAAAEQVGDVVGLHAAKLLPGGAAAKAAAKAGNEAVDAATKQAERLTFKQALKNTAKGGAEGFATEAPTEGYQSWAEGEIQGKPASASDIYAGTVIGGAAGSGLSSGVRGLKEMGELASQKPKPTTDAGTLNAPNTPELQAIVDTAIKTGDVSGLLSKPSSKDYAPAKALGALLGHSQANPDQHAGNMKKADEILQGLDDALGLARDMALTPAAIQKQIDIYTEKRSALADDHPNADLFDEAIKDSKTLLARVNAMTPKGRQENEQRIARLEAQKAEADRVYGHLQALQAKEAGSTIADQDPDSKSVDEVNTLIAKATQQDDVQEKGQAAEQLFTMAMRGSTHVDEQTAMALVNDTGNGLNDSQRSFLREFSAARVAYNKLQSLGSVTNTIFNGDEANRQRGINTYQSMMNRAIAAKDRRGALRTLGDLRSWFENSQGKSEALQSALKLGSEFKVFKKDGEWVAEKANLSSAELRKQGGLENITPALAERTQMEAMALLAAYQLLQSTFEHAFSQPAKTSNPTQSAPQATKDSTNVPNLAQQGAGKTSQAPTTETKDTVVKSQVDQGAGRTAAASAAKADVEKSRVNSDGRASGSPVNQTQESGSEVKSQSPAVDSKPTDDAPSRVSEKTQDTSVDLKEHKSEGTTLNDAPKEKPLEVKDDSKESVVPTPQKPPEVAVKSTDKSTVDTAQEAPEQVQEATNEGKATDAPAEPVKGLAVLQEGQEHNKQFDGKPLGEKITTNGVELSVFQLMNKAAAWLKQKTQSAKDAVDGRHDAPLAVIPNFLSRWISGEVEVNDVLGYTPTDDQVYALNVFKATALKWAPEIRKQLKKKELDAWSWQDPMRDFIHDDGSVDEDLVTAISYAAVSWMYQSGMRHHMPDKSIMSMLGLDEDSGTVTSAGREALSTMSGTYDKTVSDMGRAVVQALALSTKDEAPVEYLPRVQSAMGAQVLALLTRQEIVEVRAFNQTMLDGFVVTNEPFGGVRTFVKLNRDADGRLKHGNQILDSQKESQGILDELMTAEKRIKFATLEPQDFTQKTADKTDQVIPAELVKSQDQTQKRPFTVIPVMQRAFAALGDTAVLRAAGWRDMLTDGIQASRLKSVRARNESLETQLKDAQDLMTDLPAGTKFYTLRKVARNFRVNAATRNLDPQNSKIHRVLFQHAGWTSTIDPKADDATLMNYYMALAQALGYKTDAKPFDEVLADFRNDLNGKKTYIKQMAMGIYNATKEDDPVPLTGKQQETIGKFAADKEGMATIQGLVSLGQFLAAKNSKEQAPFETTLLTGVDGKTNGAILSTLLYGAAKNVADMTQRVARGGVLTRDSGVHNYNHLAAQPDFADTYQHAAKVMIGLLKSKKEAFSALTEILGTLQDTNGKITSAGRNLTKTPTTMTYFGSGTKGIVTSMTRDFIDKMYDRIEKVHREGASDDQVQQLIGAINYFLQGGQKLPVTLSSEGLLAHQFTAAQLRTISQRFNSVFGDSYQRGYKIPGVVSQVGQVTAGPFLMRADDANKAARAIHGIYKVLFDTYQHQLIEELMDSGEMAYRIKTPKEGPQERVPLHGLNQAQIQKIKDRIGLMLPQINTAMSKDSGNFGEGLYLGKTEVAQAWEGEHNTVKAQLGISVFNGNSKKPYVDVNPFMRQETGPGVSTVVNSTHSTDSTTMYRSTVDSDSISFHDEISNAAHKAAEIAQDINKNMLDAVMGYSPLMELRTAMERAVKHLASMSKSGVIDDADLAAVQDRLIAIYDGWGMLNLTRENVIEYALNNITNTQIAADTLRNEFHPLIGSVDQYTWEGGEFRVPENYTQGKTLPTPQRADAVVKALDVLNQVKTENINVQSTKVHLAPTEFSEEDSVTEDTVDSGPVESRVSPEPEAETFAEEGQTITSVFGDLGQSNIPSDQALVDFFTKNPDTTVGRVVEELQRLYKRDASPMSKFNLKLLAAVSRLIDPKLVIQYITPSTQESEIKGEIQKDARGWFTHNEDATKGVIYVLSPEFKQSGLTPDMLLHELVHAALGRAVRSTAASAQPYIKELNALLAAVRDHIKRNKIDGYKEATSNLDEFLAWGLTSQKFQQEVLAKVSFESKTLGGKIKSAMQGFIHALAGLLGFKSIAEANGLGVLIANASELMSHAAETDPTAPLESAKAETQSMTMATKSPAEHFSTQELYQALDSGAVAPEFGQHHQALLAGIVNRLHGPQGSLYEAARKTEAGNAYAVWLKAMETGKAPFAAQVVASPIQSSAQEDFVMEQVEATMRAALDGNDAVTTTTYSSLARLFREASQRIQPKDFHDGDWATATPDQKTLAQQQYDFMFKLPASQQARSQHLARFAAMGLGNQKISSMLGFNTEMRSRDWFSGNTLYERLRTLFYRALQAIESVLTKTQDGQVANEKLATLVEQLVDIEAKRRTRLLRNNQRSNVVDTLDADASKLLNKAKGKLIAFAGSSLFRNSSNGLVQGSAAVVRTLAGNRADAFMDHLGGLRDQLRQERNGLLAGILTELKHPGQVYKNLLRATKRNEQLRDVVNTQTAKLVMGGFEEGGSHLSEPAKAAITSVFLRSGAHALLGSMTLQEIHAALTDPTAMEAAVQARASQLSGSTAGFVIRQAKDLGYLKATGEAKNPRLMLNAHNILTAAGHTEVNAKEQQALTELIALYAMQYSTNKAIAAQVLGHELQRTDGNGIELVLRVAGNMEKESLGTLFDGDPTQMMHGYTAEILNPYTELQVATTEEQAKELSNRGYTEVGPLVKDPRDNKTPAGTLFILKDAGMSPYASGAVSLTSTHTRGTQAHSGVLNPRTTAGLENAQFNSKMLQGSRPNLRESAASAHSYDPAQVDRSFMVPVLNDRGDIVNWRYLMSEAHKDRYLERTNDFSKVMGQMAGSLFDKPSAKEQNLRITEALKEIYNSEFAHNPSRFLEIGPRSQDPKMREMWAMLPYSMKAAAQQAWGAPMLVVRKDSMDILFGYRKLSVADMFRSANDQRQALRERGIVDPKLEDVDLPGWQKLVVGVVEAILTTHGMAKGMNKQDATARAARAAVLMGRAERGWQEVVKEAKDVIVIKTGIVLLGNILSNVTLLQLHGVSFKDNWRDSLVAIKGATAYLDDRNRLFQLKAFMETGYTQGNEASIQQEIRLLEDAMARNPVRKLIEAGLMPTIVDDVAVEQSPYSYKSRLHKKVEASTSWLHPVVKSSLRQIYMAHDTAAYKALSRATQLSDFVGRYVLYQHLTQRKDNPLSEKEAIERALDAFINYDIPMPQSLQYADDMGLIYFTKYFLRIQRELAKLIQEHPARVLSLGVLDHMMDLGPIVLEGHWVHHLGNNPLEWGAFKYPASLGQLGTVAGALAVVQ